MRARIVGVALAVAGSSAFTSAAEAQWASDFPGVPRAAISIRGSKQTRTEWTIEGRQAETTGSTEKTMGAGVRIGIGRSYRVGDQWEWGFDYTFADLTAQMPPGGSTAKNYYRGLLAYGFRLGAKYRPYSDIDQDGNGIEAAIGAGYQPKLSALFGYESLGDSGRTGGQFGDKEKTAASAFFPQNPFTPLPSTVMLAAMGSYRSKRFIADAALVSETASANSAEDGPSPINSVDGFALRGGASYRLTPSVAIGGVLWGTGAAPWRDELRFGLPGKKHTSQYAVLFQFGSKPESGTDLIVTSPTGNFSESVRLYIRTRATP